MLHCHPPCMLAVDQYVKLVFTFEFECVKHGGVCFIQATTATKLPVTLFVRL